MKQATCDLLALAQETIEKAEKATEFEDMRDEPSFTFRAFARYAAPLLAQEVLRLRAAIGKLPEDVQRCLIGG